MTKQRRTNKAELVHSAVTLTSDLILLLRIAILDSAEPETPFACKIKEMTRLPVNLIVTNELSPSDPQQTPLLIIGQHEHLEALEYSTIKCKFKRRLNEDNYKLGLESLRPSLTNNASVSLYLNTAILTCLPKSCSRHNAPSRSHAVSKAVKKSLTDKNDCIVLICEKQDVFASVSAIAKAFPIYNKKTTATGTGNNNMSNGHGVGEANNIGPTPTTTTIEILLATPNPNPDNGPDKFEIGQDKLSDRELTLLEDTVWAIRNAAKIVDTPCSEMNTNQFIKEAEEIALKLGISPIIIRGEELKHFGLGGIYSVGRAAEHPPALIILSHLPDKATDTIAWVGKGIVFDTGGLSLKSGSAMCRMKVDCGGAAAILNAFYLAVKNGFEQNLHALLCVAENSIGPLATRPDDVLTMFSKKTVEVNNTDAEGRLVLADGIAFAKEKLSANIIIDMATLTSAQGITTGKYHCAMLTNSEEWELAGRKAGRRSGELVFPIVFTPELHFSEFKSVVADMKNSVADRTNALSSCAGLFIMSHIGFDFDGIYAHFDIGPGCAEIDQRATGFGVGLLVTLFGHMSGSELLNSLSPFTDL